MVISEGKIADAFVHSWQICLALWHIYHFIVLFHLKKELGVKSQIKLAGRVIRKGLGGSCGLAMGASEDMLAGQIYGDVQSQVFLKASDLVMW